MSENFKTDFEAQSIFIEVAKEFDGITVKDFLKNHLKLSSSVIKRVKFGGIFVNDIAVTVRKVIVSGDRLVIRFPTECSEGIEPIYVPLKIIYEDDYILAVDKPADMPVHPSKGNHMLTLANGIMAYMGEKFVFRAINRLDRDTSGIVVVAKSQLVASKMSEAMKKGQFEKHYLALLSSPPKEECGIIDAPIEREAERSIKRVVRSDGKRAITEYRVIEVLSDGRALCDIRLHTGRTHQIRVHMAYIGAPLFADFLYGTAVPEEKYFLRCINMRFPHPITSEMMDLRVEK